jgi:hypothetical protein
VFLIICRFSFVLGKYFTLDQFPLRAYLFGQNWVEFIWISEIGLFGPPWNWSSELDPIPPSGIRSIGKIQTKNIGNAQNRSDPVLTPSCSRHTTVPHPLAWWVPTNPITSDTRPRRSRPLSAAILDLSSSIRRSSHHPRGSLAPPSKSLKRGREPPSSSPEPCHCHRVRGSASTAVFYRSKAKPPPLREGIHDRCRLLPIRSQAAANAWGDVVILRSNRDTTGNLVDPSLDLCWCRTSCFSQWK